VGLISKIGSITITVPSGTQVILTMPTDRENDPLCMKYRDTSWYETMSALNGKICELGRPHQFQVGQTMYDGYFLNPGDVVWAPCEWLNIYQRQGRLW
jgi:hypothetical protein